MAAESITEEWTGSDEYWNQHTEPFAMSFFVSGPVTDQSATDSMAPRDQGCPAGRADSGSGIEAGPFLSFRSHAIQVGRTNRRMPEAAQVPVAHVIHENDDVGGAGC